MCLDIRENSKFASVITCGKYVIEFINLEKLKPLASLPCLCGDSMRSLSL